MGKEIGFPVSVIKILFCKICLKYLKSKKKNRKWAISRRNGKKNHSCTYVAIESQTETICKRCKSTVNSYTLYRAQTETPISQEIPDRKHEEKNKHQHQLQRTKYSSTASFQENERKFHNLV